MPPKWKLDNDVMFVQVCLRKARVCHAVEFVNMILQTLVCRVKVPYEPVRTQVQLVTSCKRGKKVRIHLTGYTTAYSWGFIGPD